MMIWRTSSLEGGVLIVPDKGRDVSMRPPIIPGLDVGATRFSPLADAYDMYIEYVELETHTMLRESHANTSVS